MIDGFAFDLMIDPTSYDREEAKRICRLFLSGLFPRDFSGAPQPASAAAVMAAVQRLQSERAQALAALEQKERATLEALARGETAGLPPKSS